MNRSQQNPIETGVETSPTELHKKPVTWYDHAFSPWKHGRRAAARAWKLPLDLNRDAQTFWQCKACGWRGHMSVPHAEYRLELHNIKCVSCKQTAWEPARQRVLCAHLGDVFDDAVPNEWRVDLFRLIRQTPNLDWYLLTKHIKNADEMLTEALLQLPRDELCGMGCDYTPFGQWPWSNVRLGLTVCNNDDAQDISALYQIEAAGRFLNIEPMLEEIDILKWLDPYTCLNCGYHGDECDAGPEDCAECGHEFGADDTCQNCGADDRSARRTCPRCESGISYDHDYAYVYSRWRYCGSDKMSLLDLVIVGGEAGINARPLHPDWVRKIRDCCKDHRTPFFFNGFGGWRPVPEDASPDGGFCFADGTWMQRADNQYDGQLLDGRKHLKMPKSITPD